MTKPLDTAQIMDGKKYLSYLKNNLIFNSYPGFMGFIF